MIKLLRLILREEICFSLPVASAPSRTREDVALGPIEARPCILSFFVFFSLELCVVFG